MEEHMVQDSLAFLDGDGVSTAEPEEEPDLTVQTGTLRDCIGKRCQSENRHKQFMSYSAGTRTGAKKCPSCQQFEPALKKVLKMEEYIFGQLKEPTDDIHILLEGVSQLMEDSKLGKVSRSAYYDAILEIPAIKKILNIKDKVVIPEGTCPPAAKAPLAMLATTFGIALEWQVKNGPFPGRVG